MRRSNRLASGDSQRGGGREALRWVLTLTISAMLAGLVAAPSYGQGHDVPEIPTVEGPITTPGNLFNGLRPGPDGTNPADFGYVTEEYFFSGTAGPNDSGYEVRVLIHRPAKPNKFTGKVIAEATHASGFGLICSAARFGIAQRGHICVDVMARALNINNTLLPFNPERYEGLHVSNDQTNEVLAQVGHLLKSNHPNSPLAADFPVDTIVFSGTSDSSNVARAYISAAHDIFRMPDASPIYDGYFLHATLGGDPIVVPDVPTIQMPTQTEVHSTDTYRLPDSDEPGNQYRLYEVAGMPHLDSREHPALPGAGCDNPNFSQYPFGAMNFLGVQHLLDWTDGAIPPYADRIEVDEVGETRVALDEFGNALGGIRSTYLDVPTHTHTVPNSGGFLCSLASYQTPLPDEVLDDLYPNRGAYVSDLNVRLATLIRDGWFPREYVEAYVKADMREFLADR